MIGDDNGKCIANCLTKMHNLKNLSNDASQLSDFNVLVPYCTSVL